MLSYHNLLFLRKCVDLLISRKASITILPFDIISDCICLHLDYMSRINLLVATYNHYHKFAHFKHLIKTDCLIGQIYTSIHQLAVTVNVNLRDIPFDYDAYIIPQWSAFSKKKPKLLAKITPDVQYPFFQIQYFDRNIERHANKTAKSCFQTRLSLHLNSHLLMPYYYKIDSGFRRLFLSVLPNAIQIADASDFVMYTNGKIYRILDEKKIVCV